MSKKCVEAGGSQKMSEVKREEVGRYAVCCGGLSCEKLQSKICVYVILNR